MDAKEKILALRKSTGLKYGEFAKMVGIPERTIQKWLSGETDPHPLMVSGVEKKVEDFLSQKDKKV